MDKRKQLALQKVLKDAQERSREAKEKADSLNSGIDAEAEAQKAEAIAKKEAQEAEEAEKIAKKEAKEAEKAQKAAEKARKKAEKAAKKAK